jgi:release factor glutamine methyltransferase
VNITDAIKQTRAELERVDVPNAIKDASLLVAHSVGRNKTFVITHPEYELTDNQSWLLADLTSRRVSREPLQYIFGSQEFYGREFKVTTDVLIPRPETEILVERAVEFLRQLESPRFCEVGVGSGCIAVSILCELPSAMAVGVDISEAALQIAHENAERHGVIDRTELLLSNVFSNIPSSSFDAIFSNPPYVSALDLDYLEPEVRDFEPTIALTSGDDGLDIIRRLAADAPARLRSGGALILELGFGQSESVRAMFDDGVWQGVEFIADLQGILRVVFAVKR